MKKGKKAPPRAAGKKKGTAHKGVSSDAETLPDHAEVLGQNRKAFPIVGIGASAGGLEAFEAFFAAMPADSGAAYILVSHLDPTHVSLLPELIQKRTELEVLKIEDRMQVRPNKVYVVPPNKKLSIKNGTLHLEDLNRSRGVTLPIDSFFRALAEDQKQNAVGIILSGTGSDGSLGVRAIKGETGMVMVEDTISAKYHGMPQSAIATGLADFILPPSEMPGQLIAYLRHEVKGLVADLRNEGRRIPDLLQEICTLLQERTGHDFSLYKESTLMRRIERRMHVQQIERLEDYVLFLNKSEIETDILFKEFLIGVTSFFRDPEAFDLLRKQILPELLGGKPDGSSLRVWVAGCSTGEEAYSVAILLKECMEDLNRKITVQIFGTDIDEAAIDEARAAVYPSSIAVDVDKARLNKWFSKEDSRYRVKKSIREMVIFAVQSLIKDPPFTKLDLICCRNVLIYFDLELQKRVISILHYGLKTSGFLFLGSSEVIGHASSLFTLQHKRWKIYTRNPISISGGSVSGWPPVRQIPRIAKQPRQEQERALQKLSSAQLTEVILNQVDAPPCVIIDERNDILYFYGRTGRYLEPVVGEVSVNVVEMARPGLKAELASAIRIAATSMEETVRKGISIEQDGGRIIVDLTVKPILENRPLRGMMMVIFKQVDTPTERKTPVKQAGLRVGEGAVEQLQEELRVTRENLQTTIEELETSNEELKSSNEELQSTNEELQSANEELETSREELQSLNEEAATVNAELQSRIDELSEINDDMRNFLDSTQIAAIFLDLELCVRRFTPKAVEIIPLVDIDFGRPIRHFASALIDTDLVGDALKVLKDLGITEREARSKNGFHYRVRTRPYRTTNNVIDGVVITFEDITALKETQEMLRIFRDKIEKQHADEIAERANTDALEEE